MTLPSSGQIKFSEIQTEFGGANPIYLSEYYRGGTYVPSGVTDVPTSGIIKLSDFYGTSNVTFTLNDVTLLADSSGSGGYSQWRILTDTLIEEKTAISSGSETIDTYTWINGGLASDYQIICDSADSRLTGALKNTWLECTSDPYWRVGGTQQNYSVNFPVRIRRKSDNTVILSADISLGLFYF